MYMKINSCYGWKNKEAVIPHKNIYLPTYLEIQASGYLICLKLECYKIYYMNNIAIIGHRLCVAKLLFYF